jgi:hypothetical protein
MPRNYQATNNLIAVSANAKETLINTEQTLDTTMLCALANIINLDFRRENNGGEAIGKEEPDVIYDRGALASATFDFEKAQPQHFAFLLAYALGVDTPSALGTGGYKHVITPIAGDLDASRSIPSFTAAQRYGLTVLKRRFASMFVDQITATFARDAFCKISGTIKGTGKRTDNIFKEIVNGYIDGTALTLAANAVQGADAPTRLMNVQQIRVDLLGTGVWTEVVYSAVSAAAPAIITMTAPAGTHTLRNFEILYIPAETAWMTFPARITETPLIVSKMNLIVGGGWSGTAFVGGRILSAEMKQLVWTFNNNLKVEYVPGAGGLYAARAIRDGRAQTIKLDHEFREFIMQQHMSVNDTFGLYILAQGELYDTTYYYQVEIIFPQVGVLTAPISVDGKRLAEAGDIQVMEHSTYGSVIVNVQNKQAAYAA